MSGLPKCPQCGSEFTYDDGTQYVCPECAHEWPKDATAATDDAKAVRDANGNLLADGDTVTVIKDLKVKGSSSVVKVGKDRWYRGDAVEVGVREEGIGRPDSTWRDR